MRLYLDNCCFNRPYDDRSHETVFLEAEAKLYIQEQIRDGAFDLVWSFILDFENDVNPFIERRESIAEWKRIAKVYVAAHEKIRDHARELVNAYALKPKDALHVASAVHASCEYVLTTDKALIRKLQSIGVTRVCNPIDFVYIAEDMR